MRVSLSLQTEQLIKARMRSGGYLSADELIRRGLLALPEDNMPDEEYVQEMRRKIAEGLASIEAGRALSGEEVYQRLLERRKTYKGPR